jgi:transcriptional regulator with XRE-family HTH domain
MEEINQRLGSRIRHLRESSGLTQEQLADCGKIHRTHMGEIERGECNVTIKTLQKVAMALDTSVSTLLRGIA